MEWLDASECYRTKPLIPTIFGSFWHPIDLIWQFNNNKKIELTQVK